MNMKRGIFFGFTAILAAAVFILAGCTNPAGSEDNSFVAVTGITGISSQIIVGTPITLNGTVVPANATNKTITWEVITPGSTYATLIGGSVLSVTATGQLAVKAIIENGLTESTPYEENFIITAYMPGTAPTVTSVIVNPASASVDKGKKTTFDVVVTGTNNPSGDVWWSIEQTNKKAGTAISAGGELTVASDETLTTLTVKATSKVDLTKYGTATVTVTGGSSSTQGLTKAEQEMWDEIKAQYKKDPSISQEWTGFGLPADPNKWTVAQVKMVYEFLLGSEIESVPLPANLQNTTWRNSGNILTFKVDEIVLTQGSNVRNFIVISAVQNGKIEAVEEGDSYSDVFCSSYSIVGTTLTLNGDRSFSGTYTKEVSSSGTQGLTPDEQEFWNMIKSMYQNDSSVSSFWTGEGLPADPARWTVTQVKAAYQEFSKLMNGTPINIASF